MIQSVAFIVCDNGLGHARRVAAVVAAIRGTAPGVEVAVLADPARCARFGLTATSPFLTETIAQRLIDGVPSSCRWDERLPELSRFDQVVSDNLVEVLAVRPDAMLMGSFLWHQALPQADLNFRSRAQTLLSMRRPVLLGTAPFVSPKARALTQFHDVGFVLPPGVTPRHVEPKSRGDLLIAIGKGGAVQQPARLLLEKLAQGPRPVFEFVHVEPDLMPANRPAWMQPADFSAEMYQSTVAALIRPGMGTVTDALAAGARLYCFAEPDNDEMRDNLAAVEMLGVGRAFHGLDGALRAFEVAQQEYQDSAISAAHFSAVQQLNFDGAARAAAWILHRA